MLSGIELTIEVVMHFQTIEKTAAYEVIAKVRIFKKKDKNYKPNIFDYADYKGWDREFVLFAYYAKEEQIVNYCVNKLMIKPVVINSKYGGQQSIIFNYDDNYDIGIKNRD